MSYVQAIIDGDTNEHTKRSHIISNRMFNKYALEHIPNVYDGNGNALDLLDHPNIMRVYNYMHTLDLSPQTFNVRIAFIKAVVRQRGMMDIYFKSKATKPTEAYTILYGSMFNDIVSAAAQIATSEAQALRNQIVIQLLRLGLRRNEVTALKWCDITLKDNNYILNIRPIKKGNGRWIILPKVVVATLNAWQALCPNPKNNLTTHIVRRIRQNGRVSLHGISDDAIWRMVKAIGQHMNIDTPLRPIDLRRSFITNLSNSKIVREDTIRHWVGHTSAGVTDTYFYSIEPAEADFILIAKWFDNNCPAPAPTAKIDYNPPATTDLSSFIEAMHKK